MDDPEQVANAARKYLPASASAIVWTGWGTALKPAWEPICVARKPLDGTVAANVLKHGCGGLNVYAGRVGDGDGRFPANLVHDGSPDVVAAFPVEAGAAAPVRGTETSATTKEIYGDRARVPGAFHADKGSASRFFWSPKANADDRAGSSHPTIKPLALMRYLVKLVTPAGGCVLDPFAGSGTTGEAAMLEGFDAKLIELMPEHVADIRRRLARAGGGDTPLFAFNQSLPLEITA